MFVAARNTSGGRRAGSSGSCRRSLSTRRRNSGIRFHDQQSGVIWNYGMSFGEAESTTGSLRIWGELKENHYIK
jgi:hypothetical protein